MVGATGSLFCVRGFSGFLLRRQPQGDVLFFLQCPQCGAIVELPADSVGTDRSDPWNVAECLECDSSFDFDNEEVQFDPDVQNVL